MHTHTHTYNTISRRNDPLYEASREASFESIDSDISELENANIFPAKRSSMIDPRNIDRFKLYFQGSCPDNPFTRRLKYETCE